MVKVIKFFLSMAVALFIISCGGKVFDIPMMECDNSGKIKALISEVSLSPSEIMNGNDKMLIQPICMQNGLNLVDVKCSGKKAQAVCK